MSTIVEVDESGMLRLPATILPQSAPHTRYIASTHGQQVVLSPAGVEEPFWKRATTQEWLESFNAWIAAHKDGPGLSDEAVSRESIYD